LPVAAPSADERRRAGRVPSDASAIARIPATPHRVTLVDVSRTGCQIRLADGIAVPAGATVHLDFGSGRRMTGQVMWSGPRTAGVQFARAVSGPLALALGVESAATVEVEEAPQPRQAASGPASLIPHWVRRLLSRAA
jgi:hypothetical protein